MKNVRFSEFSDRGWRKVKEIVQKSNSDAFWYLNDFFDLVPPGHSLVQNKVLDLQKRLIYHNSSITTHCTYHSQWCSIAVQLLLYTCTLSFQLTASWYEFGKSCTCIGITEPHMCLRMFKLMMNKNNTEGMYSLSLVKLRILAIMVLCNKTHYFRSHSETLWNRMSIS